MTSPLSLGFESHSACYRQNQDKFEVSRSSYLRFQKNLRLFIAAYLFRFLNSLAPAENHKNLAKNRILFKMVNVLSDLMKEITGLIREFSAIIHYFSDFMAAILLYNLIFENGTFGIVLIWIAIGLISGIIAELLKSNLPTPLRIILNRK